MPPQGPQEIELSCFQDYIPVLYLEIDRAGTVVKSSAYTDELIGREAVGLPFRDVVIDFTQSLDPAALAETPGHSRSLSISIPGGMPLDFRCSFYPLEDRTLLVGSIDAAEQQAFRRQILDLNQQLTNLTRELQKSNAELARLNQLKNQFLGMAAHDLRKPVGVVMIYSEFLIEEAEALSEEQREFLDIILSSTRFMSQIIDDFLNVAIIESGRLELNLSQAALPEVIARAGAIASLQANRKGVAFEVVQDADILPITVDESKIEQALVNLASNAIEHSYPDSTVTLRTRDLENGVEIAVEDSGVGIPPEALPGLFSPFEKKPSQKTGGEQSTGLGLVICRNIVEAHDGKITVESEVGQGSTFRIYLPYHKGE